MLELRCWFQAGSPRILQLHLPPFPLWVGPAYCEPLLWEKGTKGLRTGMSEVDWAMGYGSKHRPGACALKQMRIVRNVESTWSWLAQRVTASAKGRFGHCFLDLDSVFCFGLLLPRLRVYSCFGAQGSPLMLLVMDLTCDFCTHIFNFRQGLQPSQQSHFLFYLAEILPAGHINLSHNLPLEESKIKLCGDMFWVVVFYQLISLDRIKISLKCHSHYFHS